MNLVTELVIAKPHPGERRGGRRLRPRQRAQPEAPERFFLAHSKSPALVQASDIVEHTLDAQPYKPDPRPLYLERFITPDLRSAAEVRRVHAHCRGRAAVHHHPRRRCARDPLRRLQSAPRYRVWDNRRALRDRTNLLVTDMAQAATWPGPPRREQRRAHARPRLRRRRRSLIGRLTPVGLPAAQRARPIQAMQLGELKPPQPGEINARAAGPGYKPQSPETQRAWQYWALRAGCGDLLKNPADAALRMGTSPL